MVLVSANIRLYYTSGFRSVFSLLSVNLDCENPAGTMYYTSGFPSVFSLLFGDFACENPAGTVFFLCNGFGLCKYKAVLYVRVSQRVFFVICKFRLRKPRRDNVLYVGVSQRVFFVICKFRLRKPRRDESYLHLAIKPSASFFIRGSSSVCVFITSNCFNSVMAFCVSSFLWYAFANSK